MLSGEETDKLRGGVLLSAPLFPHAARGQELSRVLTAASSQFMRLHHYTLVVATDAFVQFDLLKTGYIRKDAGLGRRSAARAALARAPQG